MITQRLKVDGSNIVKDDNSLFVAWGHNYDNIINGNIIEEVWASDNKLYTNNNNPSQPGILTINNISWVRDSSATNVGIFVWGYTVTVTTNETIPTGMFQPSSDYGIISDFSSVWDGGSSAYSQLNVTGSNTVTMRRYWQDSNGVSTGPSASGSLSLNQGYFSKSSVEFDLFVLKNHGSKIIRICLQLDKFMIDKNTVDQTQLTNLKNVLDLAQKYDIYVIINGANTWVSANQPDWLTYASEDDRWTAQANFWKGISQKVGGHPALAWYSLINEPRDYAPSEWTGTYSGSTNQIFFNVNVADLPTDGQGNPTLPFTQRNGLYEAIISKTSDTTTEFIKFTSAFLDTVNQGIIISNIIRSGPITNTLSGNLGIYISPLPSNYTSISGISVSSTLNNTTITLSSTAKLVNGNKYYISSSGIPDANNITFTYSPSTGFTQTLSSPTGVTGANLATATITSNKYWLNGDTLNLDRHYNPYITLTPRGRNSATISYNWVLKMKGAIRDSDKGNDASTPITLGVLCLSGNPNTTTFGPSNTNLISLLNILSPHQYPDSSQDPYVAESSINQLISALKTYKNASSPAKPVMLEEGGVVLNSSIFRAGQNYLLKSKRYLSGVLNNYQSQGWLYDPSRFQLMFDSLAPFINDVPVDNASSSDKIDYPNLPNDNTKSTFNRPQIKGIRRLVPIGDKNPYIYKLTSFSTTQGLTAGTYSYAVTAVLSNGFETPAGTPQSITLSSAGKVLLSWTPYKDPETMNLDPLILPTVNKYRVYRYSGISNVPSNYSLIFETGDQNTTSIYDPISTLGQTIGSTTTTFKVNNVEMFPPSGTIKIDSETINYQSVDYVNGTITCTRINGGVHSNQIKIVFVPSSNITLSNLTGFTFSQSDSLAMPDSTYLFRSNVQGGANQTVLTPGGVNGISIGDFVSGTGISPGTKVLSISSTAATITLDTPTTSSWVSKSDVIFVRPTNTLYQISIDSSYSADTQLTTSPGSLPQGSVVYLSSSPSAASGLRLNLNSFTITSNQTINTLKNYANLSKTIQITTKKQLSTDINQPRYGDPNSFWYDSNGNGSVAVLSALNDMAVQLNLESVPSTFLSGANIDNVVNTIVVNDASAFPPSGVILIGTEYIGYSSKSGNTLYMNSGYNFPASGGRGAWNSTASSHNIGDAVKLIYAGYTSGMNSSPNTNSSSSLIKIGYPIDSIVKDSDKNVYDFDILVYLRVSDPNQAAMISVNSTDSATTFEYLSKNYLGEYLSGTYYSLNDLVYSAGTIYKSIKAGSFTNNSALTVTSDWQVYQSNVDYSNGFVGLKISIYKDIVTGPASWTGQTNSISFFGSTSPIVGQIISGFNIPDGTFITSVSPAGAGYTVGLNQNTTGDSNGTATVALEMKRDKDTGAALTWPQYFNYSDFKVRVSSVSGSSVTGVNVATTSGLRTMTLSGGYKALRPSTTYNISSSNNYIPSGSTFTTGSTISTSQVLPAGKAATGTGSGTATISLATSHFIAVNKIYVNYYQTTGSRGSGSTNSSGTELLQVQLLRSQDSSDQSGARISFTNSTANGWVSSGEGLNIGQIDQGNLDNMEIRLVPTSSSTYATDGNVQNLNVNTSYVEVKVTESLAAKGTPIAMII